MLLYLIFYITQLGIRCLLLRGHFFIYEFPDIGLSIYKFVIGVIIHMLIFSKVVMFALFLFLMTIDLYGSDLFFNKFGILLVLLDLMVVVFYILDLNSSIVYLLIVLGIIMYINSLFIFIAVCKLLRILTWLKILFRFTLENHGLLKCLFWFLWFLWTILNLQGNYCLNM